jgi:sugar/nucleoside kinase (ribokinase family)
VSREQGIISPLLGVDTRDTFSGVLMAQLVGGKDIDEAIHIAQKAAVMTLSSPQAVSEQIRALKT